jgi:hypothetical protein
MAAQGGVSIKLLHGQCKVEGAALVTNILCFRPSMWLRSQCRQESLIVSVSIQEPGGSCKGIQTHDQQS